MKKSSIYLRLTIFQILLFLSLSFSSFSQKAFTSGSTWVNESGSIMVIENVLPTGEINGYYINMNSEYHCYGTPYPLTGWIILGENPVTFTVKWDNSHENCQSITSWTGFLNSENNKITTLWQLVSNNTIDTRQIVQGSDVFTLRKTQVNKSMVKKK